MYLQKINQRIFIFVQLILFFDSYGHPITHVNHKVLQPFVLQSSSFVQQEQFAKNELISKTPRDSDNISLAQIHELRITGHLDVARDFAISYLNSHPDDVDVILELGLIYFQQKNYAQAQIYLNLVLTKAPTYFDARVGLIKTMIAEKNIKMP